VKRILPRWNCRLRSFWRSETLVFPYTRMSEPVAYDSKIGEERVDELDALMNEVQ
jgi:hypothetical protein